MNKNIIKLFIIYIISIFSPGLWPVRGVVMIVVLKQLETLSLAQIVCWHAVTKSPPFCPQYQGLCPCVKIKCCLFQVLQCPLHEFKCMTINTWTTFGWNHGTCLLLSIHRQETEKLDRQNKHHRLHISVQCHSDLRCRTRYRQQ